MNRTSILQSILLGTIVTFCACHSKEKPKPVQNYVPDVRENGRLIIFHTPENIEFLKVDTVSEKGVVASITVPAKVSATVVPSGQGALQNILLFDNPDLASSYTLLIQHQVNIRQIEDINIRQKQIELDRARDLQAHGAATGKDLLDAQTALSMEQTNLANERAALIEHEAKLKAGGFNPETLRKAGTGTAYITCDIPENQVTKIKEGTACTIQFTAFPDETYQGRIDNVADMVDNSTRMVKLRVTLKNTDNRFKAGMFALVSFGVDEGRGMSVNKTALITVQGKNYVFIKRDALSFERKEVSVGPQIGDKILIHSGIAPGDHVVVQGSIQLKGLSFGY